MSNLKYIPLATDQANKYNVGNQDDNGQIPETLVSDGTGIPCRHCLADIGENEPCLLLGYRPFPKADPYAEIGPIFIHKNHCTSFAEDMIPKIISKREQAIIRGYNKNNRIVDGTGKVVLTNNIEEKLIQILTHESVIYAHVRSATNNCYLCRVELAA